MTVEQTPGGTLITGEDIGRYRLLALKGRLRLEIKGLRFGGRPTGVIIREITGLTQRNRTALLAAYEAWLEDNL